MSGSSSSSRPPVGPRPKRAIEAGCGAVVVTPIVSAATSSNAAPPESTVVVKGEEDPSENVEETSDEQPEKGRPFTPLTGVGSGTGPVDQRAALELALQLLAISSGTGEAMARAEATPPEGSISTAPSVRAAQRGRLSRILAVVAVAVVIATVGGAILR